MWSTWQCALAETLGLGVSVSYGGGAGVSQLIRFAHEKLLIGSPVAFPFSVAMRAGFCGTSSFARWCHPLLLLGVGTRDIYKEACIDFLVEKVS